MLSSNLNDILRPSKQTDRRINSNLCSTAAKKKKKILDTTVYTRDVNTDIVASFFSLK